MDDKQRAIRDVLQRTSETLETAKFGLNDFLSHDARRKMPGLRNLIVFGRAVTNVLQNLRTYDRVRFDQWYGPLRSEMDQDPLLKFVYNLRSEILKEGKIGIGGSSTHISYLNTGDLMRSLPPSPVGATSFFIGDHLGGSGWEVPQPDGSIEKYYVALPEGSGITTRMHFTNPPSRHLGEDLIETSTESIATLYFGYLSNLVVKAYEEFMPT